MSQKVRVTMLNGQVVEGKFTPQFPFADRRAFEQHFNMPITVMAKAAGSITKEVVADESRLAEVLKTIDVADLPRDEWTAFFVWRQLKRQEAVHQSFDEWADNVDQLEIITAPGSVEDPNPFAEAVPSDLAQLPGS